MTTSKGSTPRICVAIDDGYARTKVQVPGQPPASFITSVKPGRSGRSSISGSKSSSVYTVNGQDFTVDEETSSEDTRYEGYHGSELNLVAVHHALHKNNLAGTEVDLCVGLPLDRFYQKTGGEDEVAVRRKKEALLKPVIRVNGADGDQVKIANVSIAPQAIAAFIDFVYDDNMMPRNDPTLSTIVVDIGGQTTDVAYIVDGAEIVHDKSATHNSGVLNVHHKLRQLLSEKYGTPPDEISPRVIDHVARTGNFKIFGKFENVEDLVLAACSDVQGELARFMTRLIGSASYADRVIFVGGGASLFRGLKEEFPHSIIVPEPDYANVRGLAKASQA